MNSWKDLVSPGIRLAVVADHTYILEGILTVMKQIVWVEKERVSVTAAIQAKVMEKGGTIVDEVLFPITFGKNYEYWLKEDLEKLLIGEEAIAVKLKIVTAQGKNE